VANNKRRSPQKKGRGFTPVDTRHQVAENGPTSLLKRRQTVLFLILIVAVGAAAGWYFYSQRSQGGEIVTQSGLKYTDLQLGTGEYPARGDKVKVHYTGTLENGTKFDSSVDRGTPFEFTLGVGQVIKGWDEGLSTMKPGGKRRLVIPPNLGYGASSTGKIPANSTLYFDVELLGVN
jgi:FKBP-type peptidyl-prolyl cis-trans isomerase